MRKGGIALGTYHADFDAVRLIQGLLTLFAGFLFLLVRMILRGHPLLLYWICAAAAGFWLIFGFIYLPLYIRSIRCIVTSGQITVIQGILLRQEQSVLLQNVQFVRVLHGPGQGAAGLNFIILHVYGGSLFILFLSRSDSAVLLDFLRNKGVFHAP